jgi:diguanylate cyclase (GGDEF)-like protein
MSSNDVLTALREATSGSTSQIASDDWSVLFAAVLSRLRSIVSDRLGANGSSHAPDPSARGKVEALDCLAELDALHASMGLERGRCRQVERQLVDARTALAQARAELAGTRDGERRARHLALHDSLTGLPNRRYFSEQLELVLAQVEPQCPGLAVLYLDLDDLKSVNDLHGHDTGDELLRIVATRLRWALRAHDMVSRLGGDEFACLVPDLLSRDEYTHLACKLFDTVSAPVQIDRCRLIVRPSIGIATWPADGVTATALLKQADIAMYRAKRGQTGYAFFADSAEDRLTRVTAPMVVPLRAAAASTTRPRSMTGSASG